MDQSSRESPFSLRRLMQVAVVISLICCIWSDVYREFFDPSTSNNRRGYALWEYWLEESTIPRHAIFLQFDFPDKNKNAAFAQTIDYVGTYHLYPQPVLVADPSVLINDGHDILRNNSTPSDSWLRDHGVGSVMSVIMDPQKNLPFVKSIRFLIQPPTTDSHGG
jgi:hypothetical protein